jgi:hypothetical protein
MITAGMVFGIAACILAFFIGISIAFCGLPDINIHKHYHNKSKD